MHFIIGTAGHIDHGKTSLVKALTGIDTDRLKEEKERGITIDIGFAYWQERITILDVPGHEKFIRNMVAGVSAIDLVLLVVAADDGPMPQTYEHLEILQLLQIAHGAVILTKIDTVDPGRLNEVETEVRELLKETRFSAARMFKVSSATGEGIPELRNYLEEEAGQITGKADRGFFRLNVDRSFSIKGFGTVVTGTVLSGSLSVNDHVEQLPGRRILRIRGLQKHTQTVERVAIGDRAAVNLSSVDKNEIRRGDVLAGPHTVALTPAFYARFYLLNNIRKPFTSRTRIRLLIGTSESFGKIQTAGDEPVENGRTAYVRIIMEEPLPCAYGDRFVVREFNSSATLGGGVVLDHVEKKEAVPVAYLRSLETESLSRRIAAFVGRHKIVTLQQAASVMGCLQTDAGKALEAVEKGIIIMKDAGIVCDALHFEELRAQYLRGLQTFHLEHPQETALRKNEFKFRCFENLADGVFDALTQRLQRDRQISENGDRIALSGHRIVVDAKDERLIDRIQQEMLHDPFSPPTLESIGHGMNLKPSELNRLIRVMTALHKIVKTDEKIYFHASAVDRARQIMIDFIRENGHITIINFKERLKTSRKFALSLLEFFDASHITLRDGDRRTLDR